MTEILAYACIGICVLVMVVVAKIYYDTRKLKEPKKKSRSLY